LLARAMSKTFFSLQGANFLYRLMAYRCTSESA
jgi:hypothetical protein